MKNVPSLTQRAIVDGDHCELTHVAIVEPDGVNPDSQETLTTVPDENGPNIEPEEYVSLPFKGAGRPNEHCIAPAECTIPANYVTLLGTATI